MQTQKFGENGAFLMGVFFWCLSGFPSVGLYLIVQLHHRSDFIRIFLDSVVSRPFLSCFIYEGLHVWSFLLFRSWNCFELQLDLILHFLTTELKDLENNRRKSNYLMRIMNICRLKYVLMSETQIYFLCVFINYHSEKQAKNRSSNCDNPLCCYSQFCLDLCLL